MLESTDPGGGADVSPVEPMFVQSVPPPAPCGSDAFSFSHAMNGELLRCWAHWYVGQNGALSAIAEPPCVPPTLTTSSTQMSSGNSQFACETPAARPCSTRASAYRITS